MPEAACRDISGRESPAAILGEKLGLAVLVAECVRDRVYARCEQLNERLMSRVSRLPRCRQELQDEVSCIAGRAWYYHQTRPIRVLGGVAAATFVLGILIGLGRR